MDQKEIKELMKSFDKSGLSKMKLKNGDFEILFQKGNDVQNISTAVAPASIANMPITESAPISTIKEPTIKEEKLYIKSPMVGTFYQAPSPGSPAFVKVGDSVKKGDVVAIVEAMKIMNEIDAEFNCKILEILVNDGEPVEYDQPIFCVEKI